ncbi:MULTISPECIES: hypothetical protein [unclassified Sulfurospirillum]|uniref:hypothetical protein n=1 Tax=unclassified Sulfurospirillum TaxID=2618290 RepID=UPI0005069271|nr:MULTISPECIES: hypothetical protein [unclassified Sulfurospirillum]KFL34657.1 hypothetical protein JU57_04975 [Sulfurospirillum sp. SCADC]
MAAVTLTCFQEACKQKRYHLERLSYQALSTQLEKCETCENGLFKTNLVAARTHQVIALYWAQVHNHFTGKAVGN